MVKSGYSYVTQTFQNHDESFQSEHWKRMIQFRRGPTVARLEHPTNIARARSLGYKAKQGYIIVVTKVRRGTMHKIRPKMGRKPGNLGVSRITTKKSLKWIAEERTAKKYKNMQILNSYKIGSDGKSHFFEVILIDPNHPVIKKDPKINWIAASNNHSRVYRGLTSAGKKTRGLHRKGKGTEKIRPSLRANRNLH
ncbi:MAG: 50S ribosomal protein L15e [Promethearchaeota archaeon]